MKRTVQQVIDALGGQSAVSRLSGMSRTAVRNWYRKNSVPHWQEDKFATLVKQVPRKRKVN